MPGGRAWLALGVGLLVFGLVFLVAARFAGSEELRDLGEPVLRRLGLRRAPRV